MKRRPVIDFHCDLLAYLAADPSRSAAHPEVRCSIPQMEEGGVALQVLALFSEGVGAPECALQLKSLQELVAREEVIAIRKKEELKAAMQGQKPGVMVAIEGAATVSNTPKDLFKAIEFIEKTHAKLAYISLTWNGENAYGGGAHTDVGLKSAGKELIKWLDSRKIAVDLSHASDRLAYEMIEEIDKRGVQVPVIASHSNARTILDAPRNLPDPLIFEICHRSGIIGINFVKKFVGSSMGEHLSYLMNLVGEETVVLGADFFYPDDFPELRDEELFFDEYGDASCYQQLLQKWKEELHLKEEAIEKLAFSNALNWVEKIF